MKMGIKKPGFKFETIMSEMDLSYKVPSYKCRGSCRVLSLPKRPSACRYTCPSSCLQLLDFGLKMQPAALSVCLSVQKYNPLLVHQSVCVWKCNPRLQPGGAAHRFLTYGICETCCLSETLSRLLTRVKTAGPGGLPDLRKRVDWSWHGHTSMAMSKAMLAGAVQQRGHPGGVREAHLGLHTWRPAALCKKVWACCRPGQSVHFGYRPHRLSAVTKPALVSEAAALSGLSVCLLPPCPPPPKG
jgi:hypothetical protein